MIPYNFIGDIIYDKYTENIDGKKSYSVEFKRNSASLMLDRKCSVPEVSQAVGVGFRLVQELPEVKKE